MVNPLQVVVKVGKYHYTVPKSIAKIVEQTHHSFDRYFDKFGSFENTLKFISDEFRIKKNEAIYALENGEMKYKIEGSKHAVATPDEFNFKGLIQVHNHSSALSQKS